MFEHQYEIRYGDMQNFDAVKPTALLDMVQDAAIRNSDALGYGIFRLRDMDLAWLMQGIHLQILKTPTPRAPVTVHTAVKNMRGVTSERGCILYQDGTPVARTIANWFLFSSADMRPCRIPADMAEHYQLHDFGDDFFSYKKPELVDCSAVDSITVTTRELDTNNHLNNQKGAEILVSALPADFVFTDAVLYYKKAAYFGRRLQICIGEIQGGYQVQLIGPDGDLCVAGSFTA